MTLFRKGLKMLILTAAALSLFPGCAGKDSTSGVFTLVIGSPGHTAGKFNRPRGMTYYAPDDALFILDWDGRIQKFSSDGSFRASWIMPDVKVGKPEDICVAINNNLLVADTHYSRVIEFTRSGDIVRSFGSYGRGPGQFIYPVGICTDSGGNIYVSEYGENDRIQKFSPDGTYITSWGKFGEAPGEFQRPSGLAMTTNNILYVADAVNHRVQVFSPDGELLKIIGGPGDEPGRFRYPYDVEIKGEKLYVLEYGSHRVQRMSLDGEPDGAIGQPGSGDGCFASPWRSTVAGGAIYIADTDNNRVVRLEKSF
jgi:DNA-binding beta-propeller fold protein YncE